MELTWTNILAAALILHGVGHVGGWWVLGKSWLLSNSLGSTTSRTLGSIIWLGAIVGFTGAGLGILGLVGNLQVWRSLTAISVLVSLSVIVLFAGRGATWNVGGAVVGNMIAIAAVATSSIWA